MNNLVVGDVVNLKSGGPDLTVEAVIRETSVRVLWMDLAGDLQDAVIPQDCLTLKAPVTGIEVKPGVPTTR
jgi:uncharacterized protein YodC (DUF2158 family)